MSRGNVISVSWGDHLVFGEGAGRLATPDDLARRMDAWRDELGATSMHWRENGSYEAWEGSRSRAVIGRGSRRPTESTGTSSRSPRVPPELPGSRRGCTWRRS